MFVPIYGELNYQGLKLSITMLETRKYQSLKSEFCEVYVYLATAIAKRTKTVKIDINFASNDCFIINKKLN